VKKFNPIKSNNLFKLDTIINEQSIIQEQPNTEVFEVKPKMSDFSVGVSYFLKDGTKVNFFYLFIRFP
jgi:hypothetical protein